MRTALWASFSLGKLQGILRFSTQSTSGQVAKTPHTYRGFLENSLKIRNREF